ncbi:ras-related protein Rab-21-like [Artemia franciscana]|uniref:ras-related protein Rab-21-like n=1 Tax=Artemia franciscana TaxID=6661 RepID=UPI0032DBB44D
MTDVKKYNFKVVLLGEGAVGKTSLVLQYVHGKFSEAHESTIQASFLTKKINLPGKVANLAIWDTAGQERYHALGPIYYRDSQGAILVYDITDKESFKRVQNWIKELRKMLGEEVCILIAGNKIDLESERAINLATCESYADTVGAHHVSTSAKINKGIDELFFNITKRMIEKADEKASNSLCRNGVSRASSRRSVVVVEDDVPQKKSCCG